MKPLKLSIAGLHSFSERQEIDFEALCETGLFGIFGPTGSGKSSILDSTGVIRQCRTGGPGDERHFKQPEGSAGGVVYLYHRDGFQPENLPGRTEF